MKALLNWFDDRTGCRALVHEALYENIPGGAKWRYVWGSTLVFAFTIQMITGMFLWMAYSPSTQTAWESVYYIQFQMGGGAFLRGLHHYTAQMMVVLLALHLFQVVVCGAYRAPREINFWLGLVLLKIVLGLALTGYLLPWDEKGYWATQVATKIAGIVPVVGPQLKQLVVGGNEYGHHTLTRFFALHAGVLPALLVGFLVLHVAIFRRHGITAKSSPKSPDAAFWPDQVLKDAVACLAVLLVVGFLAWKAPAELGAPADPAKSYDAARPEWYFLFLFQFLKFFHGEVGEVLGAIVFPGLIMGALFLMPIVGRSQFGHRLNVAFLCVLLAGSGVLTGLALWEDRQSQWVNGEKFDEVDQALTAIRQDMAQNQSGSPYAALEDDKERLALYAEKNEIPAASLTGKLTGYLAYRKSAEHLEAVEQAERDGERARELADQGIPPQGNLYQMRNDSKTQGPRLFAQKCASCHNHENLAGGDASRNVVNSSPTAPNLYGFGTREWIAGVLDPERIVSEHYFGYADSPFVDGDMVNWVNDHVRDVGESEKAEVVEHLKQVVAALSAQAGLKSQRALDEQEQAKIAAGETLIKETLGCTDCHKFQDAGDLGYAPDLTDYASRAWLIDFIRDPGHERFYRDTNDRMPAFAPHLDDPSRNQLDDRTLGLIVDWLRGEWYEPEEAEEE